MTHQAYKRSSKTTGEAGCHAPWLIKNLGVYSTYFKIQGEERWGRARGHERAAGMLKARTGFDTRLLTL